MSSNIGQIVKDNFPFLKQLARTRSVRRRKNILSNATSEQLLSLVEICLNIVRNSFPLTRRQKYRILPFAGFVRRAARLRTERGARHTVVQQGSGLPIGLFPALLTPIIIELTKNLFSKNT